MVIVVDTISFRVRFVWDKEDGEPTDWAFDGTPVALGRVYDGDDRAPWADVLKPREIASLENLLRRIQVRANKDMSAKQPMAQAGTRPMT